MKIGIANGIIQSMPESFTTVGRVVSQALPGLVSTITGRTLPQYTVSAGGCSGIEFDFGICFDTSTGGVGFVTQIAAAAGVVGALVALVLVVIGAYKVMMSGGDSKKIQDGKEQIMNALLGFGLILTATAIISMVFSTLGIS